MAIIGDALSVLSLRATIHVSTMPGATVNLTHGSKTATLTANSSGNCDLEVLVPDFGTWNLTATSGNASGTASVNVAAPATTYNVTVTLRLWIIQNGNFASWTGHKYVGGGNGAYFNDVGSYVELSTYQGGSNDYIAGYITPAVSFGYWKSLVIDSQEKGDNAYVGPATNSTSNPPSFSTSARMVGKVEEWDSRHTTTCNVSSVTGSKYIAIQGKAWVEWDQFMTVHGTGGNVRIWNLYLTG